MGYPTFEAGTGWFKSSRKRNYFTKITIKDSYAAPDGVTLWNAATADSDPIYCYEVGTELVIAGNGSGRIYTNANAAKMFGRIKESDDYFENVEVLEGLEILDTSNTAYMDTMFQALHKVKEFDLRNFNTSKVETMQGMFSAKNGSAMQVEKIHGLEDLDVSNVWNLYYVFAGCANLKSLNLRKWVVTDKCTTIRQICYLCESLEHIYGTENWNVSNVETMYGAFFNCKKMKELNLTGWTTSGGVNKEGMLSGTDCLEKITVSKGFDFNTTGISNPAIDGSDGEWHTMHGGSFAANAMPSGVNLTYYATKAAAKADLAKLKNTFILLDGNTAVDIADAIRGITGKYGDLKPAEWAKAISGQEKAVT